MPPVMFCPQCFKVQPPINLCDCGSRLQEATPEQAKVGEAMNRILSANRLRDLYFRQAERGTVNVILLPQGWCDAFTCKQGFTGGPDFDEGPEVYGYGPTRWASNDSEVDTLFWEIETLARCEEITEAQARLIHPNLFSFLDAINAAVPH